MFCAHSIIPVDLGSDVSRVTLSCIDVENLCCFIVANIEFIIRLSVDCTSQPIFCVLLPYRTSCDATPQALEQRQQPCRGQEYAAKLQEELISSCARNQSRITMQRASSWSTIMNRQTAHQGKTRDSKRRRYAAPTTKCAPQAQPAVISCDCDDIVGRLEINPGLHTLRRWLSVTRTKTHKQSNGPLQMC